MPYPFPYRVVVEWSDDDDVYIGRVPALPGCVAHGTTMESATNETLYAADGILEAMEARGEEPPAPDAGRAYSGKLLLRIDPELHRQLAERAASEDRSLNNLLNRILQGKNDG